MCGLRETFNSHFNKVLKYDFLITIDIIMIKRVLAHSTLMDPLECFEIINLENVLHLYYSLYFDPTPTAIFQAGSMQL